MFDNLKEGQLWLEKQQNSLTKLSEITTTGDYFIMSHTFLRKVSISRIMSRKIIFGEGDLYSNKAVTRKELLGYRVVPPERIKEFEDKLEKIKQLYNLQYQAIGIVGKLSSDAFRRIRDLSPQDQQTFIDLFSEKS